MKLYSDFIKRLPKSDAREFLDVACKENFLKMLIGAVIVFVVELFIAFFIEDRQSRTFYLAIGISACQMLFIPALYYAYNNIGKKSKSWIYIIHICFVSAVLLSGILWSLFEQSFLASGSTYILSVFAVSAFIVMPPAISAITLSCAYLTFVLLLPNFQMLPEVIKTLNVNSFFMSFVAWVLNRIVSISRLDSFLNEKAMIEKNMELEKKNLELNDITMRDSMTNLLNHKNSLKRLREEAERAKRIGYPLSVAMIDLDNFKSINDSFGHQSGDDVIVEVAKILKETCRVTDVVGRYGGEEFIVIMPDTGIHDATLLFKRIQKKMRETNFKDEIKVTLSCGISEMLGESVHGILKASDMMLYEAKRKGKNRIEVHCGNSNDNVAMK